MDGWLAGRKYRQTAKIHIYTYTQWYIDTRAQVILFQTSRSSSTIICVILVMPSMSHQSYYLTMSLFHCSPSGQKLRTPSRYSSARCSLRAHTTLFLDVTCDSGQGQSTFTARAQGRSTLRPRNQKMRIALQTLAF